MVQDAVPDRQKWNSTVSQKLKPPKLRTAEQIKKNMVDQNNANLSGKRYKSVPSDAHDRVTQVASFTHSVKTRVNAVKFAHQSLCTQKYQPSSKLFDVVSLTGTLT